MTKALANIRILDMTSVVMGPYGTQILGDMGADIIKIESPTGDTTRKVPPMRNQDMGSVFLHMNRNKRSLVLDLKKPDALQALLKLAESADVLIYNVRPRAMARLGITHEKLAEVNPRIITVALVGFGQEGPYAADPAYEDLIQGLTAVPSMLVAAGSETPHYVPLSFNDRAVGLNAAIAVLGALLHRTQTGEGQAIEIPMFETMVQATYGDHMGGLSFDPPEGPPGYMRQLNKQRRPHATKDGYVCVIVYTDKHWDTFLTLIGREELKSDPRLRGIGSRTQHAEAIYGIIDAEMRNRTTAEWIEVLKQGDIPVAPLHTLESLLDDPHLKATGFFRTVEHPSEGAIRQMAPPQKWSSTPPSIYRHAPKLGEHSLELLREAGLDDASIDRMLAARATVQAQ